MSKKCQNQTKAKRGGEKTPQNYNAIQFLDGNNVENNATTILLIYTDLQVEL